MQECSHACFRIAHAYLLAEDGGLRAGHVLACGVAQLLDGFLEALCYIDALEGALPGMRANAT